MFLKIIEPNVSVSSLEAFCPSAVNANVHPTMSQFYQMTNKEMVEFYCKTYANTDEETLLNLLETPSKHFRWAGIDVIPTVNQAGEELMTVIEANSCPSGTSFQAQLGFGFSGYEQVINESFMTWLEEYPETKGELAVFIDLDKNYRECYTYAALIAQASGEKVYFCHIGDGKPEFLRWREGFAEIRESEGVWKQLRAVFRKVVHVPWSKIPVDTKTRFYNPVAACLLGGRNKALAEKAYQDFNKEFSPSGIAIQRPFTIPQLCKDDIEAVAVERNYQLVIKSPYSNAGLDVHLITQWSQLEEFFHRAAQSKYTQYLVQEIICPPRWREKSPELLASQLAPRPAKIGGSKFFFDMRMMISSGKDGWKPTSALARRASAPLAFDEQPEPSKIPAMLKTNLSEVQSDGSQAFQQSRAFYLSEDDFPFLRIDLKDLVDGYVQSVMVATAIDKMCQEILAPAHSDGYPFQVDRKTFEFRNPDFGLLSEIAWTTDDLQ